MKRLQTKRLLLTMTLGLLAATTAHAQTGAPERRNGNQFNGYVKTAQVEVAYYVKQDGALAEGPRRLSATFAYSEDGRRCDYAAYSPNGALRQRSVNVWDEQGRLILQEIYDGRDNLVGRVVSKPDEGEVLNYDGEGNLKQRVVTEHISNGVTEVRLYDANGTLTERTVMERGEGSYSRKSYDANGMLLSENSTRATKEALVEKSQTYDATGAPALRATTTVAPGSAKIDAVTEKPNGAPPQRTRETRELDSHGNLAKSIRYVWDDAKGDYVPSAVFYYTITYYR